MAELTKTKVVQSVFGDQVSITATVTGASGSTYTTNLANLLQVVTSPGTAITGFSFSGGTATLTTGGGAITAEIIQLRGR